MLLIYFLAWTLIYLVHIVVERGLFRVVNIPGPFLGRFTPYYRAWLFIWGDGPMRYAALHRKYGPVVRTGPNHVSLSNSRLIPIVYDLKHKFRKGRFYEVFRPLYQGKPLDTIFTTANPMLHKRLKKLLVVNALSRPQAFEDEIEQSVALFIQQMGETQGKAIDFSDWAFYWAFDMTYALVFGGQFGYMTSRSDFNQMVFSFKTIIRSAAVLGQVPQWCRITFANKNFMAFLSRFPKFPDPTIQLLQEIERKISEHDANPHSCNDTLLCRMLASGKHKVDEDEYTQVVNVLFEAFLAAAGEVAVSITTIIYCILKNETVYQKLAQIIRLGDDSGNTYLNAVIKEALRIHTSNCPPMERIAPVGGLQVDGYFIEEGTVLGIPQYVVHRDKAVYGPDADDFRPERWLEADADMLRAMDQNFMTFGKGCRSCVGRELAMLEMRTFLIKVILKFDIGWAFKGIRPRTTNYWMMEYFGFHISFDDFVA